MCIQILIYNNQTIYIKPKVYIFSHLLAAVTTYKGCHSTEHRAKGCTCFGVAEWRGRDSVSWGLKWLPWTNHEGAINSEESRVPSHYMQEHMHTHILKGKNM